MTLKELFEEHGQVWLASTYRNAKVFRPLGVSENKMRIIGEDEEGYSQSYMCHDEQFLLYQEKPKTVKRAQYAYIFMNNRPKISENFYINDDDFKGGKAMSNYRWFKRLDHTEIEVPE